MNFPPIIFRDPRFSSLITKSHQNQYISPLIASQNLLKKLSKFETNENNFQSNVINWLKSYSSNKDLLIKYFSINSQWFVDIVREMIIIAKFRPNSKFIFNPSTQNIYNNLPFFNLFDLNNIDEYKPKFSDYFTLDKNDEEEGFIDLGKKESKDNIQIKFLDNIRYLTLSKNKNEDKKYFFDYNNVVTLSFEYFMDIEKLINILINISKNEIFKYPLKIESLLAENGNKYYYNICNSKWLNSHFTLTELLCSYFEQNVLINYEYFLLYNQEITDLVYNRLDEHIDNIFKLVKFIGDSEEKKVEFFQSVHPDEINKIINNIDIQEIVKEKRRLSDGYHALYNSNYSFTKVHPKKEIISSTLMKLQNFFIKGDLIFVIYMTFLKNSTIFTYEDFVIKAVYDIINDFRKKKVVEELLQDFSENKNKDTNNSNHKKRKKKKRKKHNKIEEIKEYNDNKELVMNKDNDNDNNNEENKGDIIDINNDQIEKFEEKEKEVIKANNSIMKDEEKNKEIVSDINYSQNKQEKEKGEEIKNEDLKETDEDTQKTEKIFFLYPVVKGKKKKHKNKRKEKKNISNNINNIGSKNINNNANELSSSNSQNNESTKTNSSINKQISNNNKNESKNIIHISNNNETETINSVKLKNEENNIFTPQKHVNKFNIKINNDAQLAENSDNNSNGNNGYFNPNKRESNISRSNKDDKYFLVGSNVPKFTSFYFKSKKKKNRKNSEQNQFSFRANNILEFSKEILENTQKVNQNKEILQKIRGKYIKMIYEKINIILKDENVNFLCSFYGSNISGLSIENSDIDIMVKIRKNQNEINYTNRIMNTIVQKLNNDYQELNYIKNITPIYTASVPVIKIECDLSTDSYLLSDLNQLIKTYNLSYNNLTKLFFDITFFEIDNEQDKIPSELMIEYIKQSTKIYPQIYDIIYIMKKFLSIRKLNQSYQGGISSFSLFLLILAFIKFFSKNNIEFPIGSLLIEFLRFYSNFDFYNSVIRPNENNINDIYTMDDGNNIFYKYNINIVDPITGLNVAKSTFKIEEIKKAFKEGLDIIISNLYKININDNNINMNNEDINDNLNKDKILEHFFYER